ncbi:unnamed protein product [Schistocephalus solidus]|uniref:E3 UFM1-protein ligase 1 homolog n=1 Tax=Schistocephalus solidus TaxID=70667 RepID=A0A183SMF0_SCHSO|nr:unnamed protein product [Schistocephalus solidus]
MSTWAEIKELSAYLKKVQASESTNFLSERTCVDIVSHLISSGRLRLIHSIDGRCLLTVKELDREILDELELHGGHVSLLELSANLDVDLSIIESRTQELVVSTATQSPADACVLVGSDLLTKAFIRRIAEELRDRFELRGVISTIELSRMFAFPPQFILNIIAEYNGVLFRLHKDNEKYYTDSYLNKQKAKVLGYFSAALTPIPLSSAAPKLDIPQKLLLDILDTLISGSKLQGTLTAGRSVYTPRCFSIAQDSYLKSFYSQNGFVECSLARRLGIADPISYFHKTFPGAIYSRDLCVNGTLLSQLKAVITDDTDESPWIDVTSYLPLHFGPKEREWLVAPLLTKTNLVPLCDYSFLCSRDRLQGYVVVFDDVIREAAETASKQQTFTSQRQSASSFPTAQDFAAKTTSRKSKSGGFGSGSREIKTKSVKKKYMKKSGCPEDIPLDSTDTSILLEDYLSQEKLLSILSNNLGPEAPENLAEGLLDALLPELNIKFTSLLKSIFLQNSDTSKNRNRFMAEKESLVQTVLSIQLLERGAIGVDDPDLRLKLLRHLIRTDVSAFVNQLCVFLSHLYDVEWPTVQTKPVKHVPTTSSPGKSKQRRKNKKASHYNDDDSEDQAERVDSDPVPTVAEPAPVSDDSLTEITAADRENFYQMLRKLSSVGPIRDAADLLQKLNACLRPNAEINDCGSSGQPLDEIFILCDNLAANHLGVNLSVAVLRSPLAGSKRKREDKTLALNLATQIEQQLTAAANEADTSPLFLNLANVALAAAGLFGQCIVGWPLPVHGKLVPQLSTWIRTKLEAANSELKSIYPSALKELQISKAGESLVCLKDEILARARGDAGLSDEDVVTVVHELQQTGSKCLQCMNSASTT